MTKKIIDGIIGTGAIGAASIVFLSPNAPIESSYIPPTFHRVIQLPPPTADIVNAYVTRSMASPLLVFTDPNEMYPKHTFLSADGVQRIQVNDWTPLNGAPHVIYMSCDCNSAIPIIVAALNYSPSIPLATQVAPVVQTQVAAGK